MWSSSVLVLVFVSLFLSALYAKTTNAFSIREATIDELQLAFKQNQFTSKKLVTFYLQQIRRLNPILKGVIEVNPDALSLAEKADQQRINKPPNISLPILHGIPVLLKDNIATKDKLNTTAGSFALLGSVVTRDATVVAKLRKSGAIILGKASLTEWAAFRSTFLPNGFCARSGQGVNPYVRSASPCGSSSGSGISVAANLVTVSLGTETDGSIICPSSANSVVGIKPSVGLTSRYGVVPISPRQDTVGQRGAVLIDHLEISNISDILSWSESGEELALVAEFKAAMNAYLKQLVKSPVRSLADIIAFNKKFSNLEKTKEYGQDIMEEAESLKGAKDIRKSAVEKLNELSRNGLEKLMKNNKLDAIVSPYVPLSSSFSTVLAIGGYPGISVPAGYDKDGVPFGICFGGVKGSEPKLIEMAYGFEQATKIRKPPPFNA